MIAQAHATVKTNHDTFERSRKFETVETSAATTQIDVTTAVAQIYTMQFQFNICTAIVTSLRHHRYENRAALSTHSKQQL